MKEHIHIPKPCSADWSAMTPTEQGRHCALCVKTVVDFSKMSDREVLDTLKASFQKQEKVCGNFHPRQVTAPKPRVPLWGRMAAAVAGLGFLLGACSKPGNGGGGPHERLAGAVAYFPPDSTEQQCTKDTVATEDPEIYHIKGEIQRLPEPGE